MQNLRTHSLTHIHVAADRGNVDNKNKKNLSNQKLKAETLLLKKQLVYVKTILLWKHLSVQQQTYEISDFS